MNIPKYIGLRRKDYKSKIKIGMDIKKQYKLETGKIPTEIGGGYYCDDYVDWLEIKIRNLQLNDIKTKVEIMNVEYTAMQELRNDLLKTVDKSYESLEDITDLKIRNSCQTVVKMTIDTIINRIDNGLLQLEQQQKETEYRRGFKDGQQYYREEYGNKRK